jgi:hypothetical protein
MNLDFLCIGVQKAGTTWLDRVLRSHPSIWMPCVKELHYYDEKYVPFTRNWSAQHRLRHAREILEWQARSGTPDSQIAREASLIGREQVDAAWYREVFEMCPRGRLKGEVTPEYCLAGETGVREMLSDNPNAQFFLMLREPVGRDVSHMRMMLGNEGYLPGSAVTNYEHRFDQYLQWLAYEARGDYLPILDRWTRLVPKQHLHLLFFEDISTRPDQLVNLACRALGIDANLIARDIREVIHPGSKFEIPDWVMSRLRSRHASTVEELCQRFDLSDRWRRNPQSG